MDSFHKVCYLLVDDVFGDLSILILILIFVQLYELSLLSVNLHLVSSATSSQDMNLLLTACLRFHIFLLAFHTGLTYVSLVGLLSFRIRSIFLRFLLCLSRIGDDPNTCCLPCTQLFLSSKLHRSFSASDLRRGNHLLRKG